MNYKLVLKWKYCDVPIISNEIIRIFTKSPFYYNILA